MSNWSLQDHLTNYLARPGMGDSKHPTLWPSSATALVDDGKGGKKPVGKCRRANFFRYVKDCYNFYGEKYKLWEPLVEQIKQKSIPFQDYQYWVFRSGDMYEDHIIKLCMQSGVYIADQVPLYIPEYNISGKIDIKIINPDTHKFINVEVKSVYGFGGETVIGKPASKYRPVVWGEPRDSHLMQVGLYHWWHASADDAYEYSRLVYGDRGTGKFSEYLIDTREENGEIWIYYCQITPLRGNWTNSGITINSVLENYKYIQAAVDGGDIPDRDFELVYPQERIEQMYKDGELGKGDTEQYEKIQKRLEDNLQRGKEGKKLLKDLKPVEKGDWQCRLCNYKDLCYDDKAQPRTL